MGRQAVWPGHRHVYRAFVLEGVSSGPKNTDNDLTHPQLSRGKYLCPKPGEFQPAAMRKHVGARNYSRGRRRSITPLAEA